MSAQRYWKVILNGNFEASIRNLSELKPSFAQSSLNQNVTINNQSPEAFINFNAIFVGNSYDYIKDWISSNGLQNGIPYQLIDNSNILNSGLINLAEAKDNPQRKEITAQMSDYQNVFNDKFQNNLRSFVEPKKNFEVLCVNEIYPEWVAQIGAGAGILALIGSIMNYVSVFTVSNSNLGAPVSTPLLITYGVLIAISIVTYLSYLSEFFDAEKRYFIVAAKNLFQEIETYLGVPIQTDFFDDNFSKLCFLSKTDDKPAKNKASVNNEVPNWTIQEFFGKLGLLKAYELKFSNETIYFYSKQKFRFDNSFGNSGVILKNALKGFELSNNLKLLPNAMIFTFPTDSANQNSLNNFGKNRYNVYFEVINGNYQVLGEKLEINFGLTIAPQKRKTNAVEVFFNTLFDILRVFGQVLFINTDVNNIGDRRDYLLLSNDAVGNDYVFIAKSITDSNTRIDGNSENILSAKNIYENYYEPLNPINNQWLITTQTEPVPINSKELFALHTDNKAITQNGDVAILTRLDLANNGTMAQYEYWTKTTLIASDNFKIKTAEGD